MAIVYTAAMRIGTLSLAVLVAAALVTAAFVACAGPQGRVAHEAPASPASEAAPDQGPADDSGQPPTVLDNRKLIRTVDFDLRVDDTEAAAEQIQALTKEFSGYVASINAHRRLKLLHYQITIKVPVGQLDAVVDRIKALATEVLRENLKTDDVTDRFVDLEARLRSLNATETEIQGLLAESRSRGHKVEDIMAIYDQLTEIRTRIEQLQAKLNSLDNLTTFSTVNLKLTPTEAAKPIIADRWRPSATVRSSFRTLLGALQWLTDLAIVFFIVWLPVGLLIAIPIWLVFRLWQRVRGRGKTA